MIRQMGNIGKFSNRSAEQSQSEHFGAWTRRPASHGKGFSPRGIDAEVPIAVTELVSGGSWVGIYLAGVRAEPGIEENLPSFRRGRSGWIKVPTYPTGPSSPHASPRQRNPVKRASRRVKRTPVPAWKLEQAKRRREALHAIGEQYGFLTAADVHALGPGTGKNPSANPTRWARTGKVFKLTTDSVDLYPGFQFDLDTGKPLPVMKDLIKGWGGADPAGLALWLTARNEWLPDRARPVDYLVSDPDAVRGAMKHATEA